MYEAEKLELTSFDPMVSYLNRYLDLALQILFGVTPFRRGDHPTRGLVDGKELLVLVENVDGRILAQRYGLWSLNRS